MFWLANDWFHLDLAEAQTLVFVWLVFASAQAVLYATRGPGFFWSKPYPGPWVLVASLLVLGLVTLLATLGWLMAPISVPLVASVLLLALAFLIVADIVKAQRAT